MLLSRTGGTDPALATALVSDATPVSGTVGTDASAVTVTDSVVAVVVDSATVGTAAVPVTVTTSLTVVVCASGDRLTPSFDGGLYPPLPDRSTASFEGAV